MAAVIQSKASAGLTEATSTVITKPSGTVDGDLLVAIIFAEDTTVNSVPSGWGTELSHTATDPKMYVYSKVAASEGADYTWGFTGSAKVGGAIFRIDGYAPTTQWDVGASSRVADDPTPAFTNTITPTFANSLLLFAVGAMQLSTGGQETVSAYAITTSNPSWTEEVEISAAASCVLGIASATRPETTATGNSSATIGDGSTETLADCTGIVMAIAARADASVSPAVISLVGNIQAPTPSAAASITVASALSVASAVQAPTPSVAESTWKNTAKPSTASFTNTPKP